MKKVKYKEQNSLGVTLIELLVIIGILVTFAVISVSTFWYSRRESDLDNSTEEIINVLRVAQNKTLASTDASNYGVHFEANKFVLFKGTIYDHLTEDNDIYNLNNGLEIYGINLAGGGSEIVFDRVTGTTSQFGSVSLRSKTVLSKVRTIYIENFGQIGLTLPLVPSDESRIKDSRHVHFDYSRMIDTTIESLILNFEGGMVNETIVIANNIKNGQIYWEGEVEVSGSAQRIKIHTHRLNNPNTQFCIHRDRRYNNKSLIITISGDGSGSLISYTAEGQELRGTSVYLTTGGAGDPQRQ